MRQIDPRKILYPFKCWFTTLLLGTLFLLIWSYIKQWPDSSPDTLGILVLSLIFGLVFSFPAFVVFYLLYIFLIKRLSSAITSKIILCAVALTGELSTFWIMGGSGLLISVYVSYTLAILASCFMFRIDGYIVAAEGSQPEK